MTPDPVHIEKHAPERRRKPVTTLHCGCTCCCCCCLHTIGGIVGAAVAPAIGRGSPMPLTYFYDDVSGEDVPLIKKPGLSAVTVFWWIQCLSIVLALAIGLAASTGDPSPVLITGVFILLGFPVLQLASAFLTLIVFACWPRFDKFYQLKKLAKITGGIVLGTVLGILAMVAIAAAFGAIR